MTQIPAALDALEASHFDGMTSRTCRDALKEITKLPTEQVIQREVGRLSSRQQDTLMKVIYVGLSTDPDHSSVLLKWHAAVFAVAGPGAILRTLVDKAPSTAEAGGGAAA